MGRQPCCDKVGLKKGPWAAEEDKKLINFILTNGHCCWRAVPKLAGLLRCGKSCRLRWTNYLRPDLKRGLLSETEEKMVIELHSQLGNRWSKIASHLPGRTDNEIKNHWNTHIKKKLRKMGIDPLTHRPLPSPNNHESLQQEQQQQQQDDKVADENKTENKKSIIITSTVAHHQEAADAFLTRSPGFCIDDVPMVQQHEMLLPSASSTSSSSSCTSSSSSSSYVKAEEIQLPSPPMVWPESTCLYGLDDLSGWDFFSDSFSLCQRTALEQESWKFELF